MSQLTFRDLNLRIALLKAIADDIVQQMADERDGHRDLLVKKYAEDGVKSFDVRLPNGTKVSSISLAIPKDSTTVTDDAALIAWAKDNAPDLLREVTIPAVPEQVIPAQPERTEIHLDPKRVTELLERVKPIDSSGGEVVDPDTAQVVDGITYEPGGQPRSFSVHYEKEGREALALAYRAGELSHLVAGTPLPAIDAHALEAAQ